MRSLFPWMGGKSRQAKQLASLLAEHTCYVEVFSGAANLLFEKAPSKVEVINDINADIINLFRIARFHPRELVRELQFVTHNRLDYKAYRAQPGITDVQRAARTWLILRSSFGGRGGTKSPAFGYGTTGPRGFRRSAFSLIKSCHRRLANVTIENLDYAECIKRYDRPHTLFYCDPPYLETNGYLYDFTPDDHAKLAELLHSIKGKFLLSINDHRRIRKLYKGLPRRKVDVKYSVSRDKSAKARDRTELIIANYPLAPASRRKKPKKKGK